MCRVAVGDVMGSRTDSRMWMFRLHVLVFLVVLSGQHKTSALQDVTRELFGDENYGTVAAFGDLNSDKMTDIFIIREGNINARCCCSQTSVCTNYTKCQICVYNCTSQLKRIHMSGSVPLALSLLKPVYNIRPLHGRWMSDVSLGSVPFSVRVCCFR